MSGFGLTLLIAIFAVMFFANAGVELWQSYQVRTEAKFRAEKLVNLSATTQAELGQLTSQFERLRSEIGLENSAQNTMQTRLQSELNRVVRISGGRIRSLRPINSRADNDQIQFELMWDGNKHALTRMLEQISVNPMRPMIKELQITPRSSGEHALQARMMISLFYIGSEG